MSVAADRLLRSEGEFAVAREAAPWRSIAVLVGVFGAFHGAVVGSFGLRVEQALYSAAKLPLLIAASTALCAPSFYALNAVLGLRSDFAAAARGVLCAQAVVAVVLASCAPIVAVFYASGVSYRGAALLNGAVFLLASLCGQLSLARHYRPLIELNPRHRAARAAWLALYWFVTVQSAWVLRPFIGAPGIAPTFLRPHAWTNAYVEITKGLLRLD